MSQPKHTPGPWRIAHNSIEADGMPTWRSLNPRSSDPETSRAPVCRFREPSYGDWPEQSVELLNRTNEANAARIVACVNACEGFEDPADLRAQRDELLKALKAVYIPFCNLVDQANQFSSEGISAEEYLRFMGMVSQMHKGIARAEGRSA
jgi:hypothetical protein